MMTVRAITLPAELTAHTTAPEAGLGLIEVREIFGVLVHAITLEQAERLCQHAVETRGRLQIAVLNAAKIVALRRDQALREAVLGADLTLADGMSVVWASRLLGQPVPERVTGIDLFERLLVMADRQRYSVYFLGATAEVLGRLMERMRREKPGLKVAGSRDGYFSEREAERVAGEIREARPDFVFVGMSSPRKELFLARWSSVMGAAVCHGVGGAFDVAAGVVRRAPTEWQKAGMEWLYRVAQEPRRMWKRYLMTNTAFVGLVAGEMMKQWMQGKDEGTWR